MLKMLQKKAQEAIVAALAGKEEAERQSANLMEKVEQRSQKAVEEAMMRVEQQSQWKVIQNSVEVLDLDSDNEAVQDVVHIPTAKQSNRGEAPLMEHHLKGTESKKEKEMCMSSQCRSRVHFEEDTPAFAEIFDVMESKEEMGMSSKCEEEVDKTWRGKRKNKKANFATFHNFFD